MDHSQNLAKKVFLINLFWFLWMFCLIGVSHAQTSTSKIKVVLFQPIYHGPSNLEGMAKEFEDAIGRRLTAMGLSIVLQPGPARNAQEALEIGKKEGAPFSVYGPMTVVGKSFSMDLRVAWTGEGQKGVKIVSEEGVLSQKETFLDDFSKTLFDCLIAPLKIASLKVVGNRRVDTDAILQEARLREGDPFDQEKIKESIKNIFKMGFFDDIRVDVKDSPEGKLVTFLVREKPCIRKIIFKGNKAIKTEKIRETIDLKQYDIVNEKKLMENAEKIKALYGEKGYLNTKVSTSYVRVSEKAADVTFNIVEGKRAFIKKIEIEGNKAYSDKELKKLLETREKQPFWKPSLSNWLSLLKGGAGVLKWDALERDRGRISAYYHNHGYIDAKVGKPRVKRKGNELYITIPVEEVKLLKV